MKTSFIKLKRAFRLRRAFTLVEIMFSLTVGMLVLSAAASLLILMARTNYKNTLVVDSSTGTRLVQEHLNRHLSTAISQFTPPNGTATVAISPVYTDPSTTTPVRFAQITYRYAVGGYCISQPTASTASSITLTCSAETQPRRGDYLLMDNPNIGTGILIEGVSDSRTAGTAGSVTLSFPSTTIGTATLAAGGTVGAVESGGIATIHRQGAYMTTTPVAGENTVNLLWYESYPNSALVPNSTPVILSNNVDATNRHLFARQANTSGSVEAISWSFAYQAQTQDQRSAQALPGNSTFWETNSANGYILPKSSATVPLGSPPPPQTTLISTTTLEPTTSTTTLEPTTSTTTLEPTTSTTTLEPTTPKTTLKSTTPKTTLKSTTPKTTLKSTTPKTTLKSTTPKSTTLQSTTLQSSTTLKTTTILLD
jgi:hypothetical protein